MKVLRTAWVSSLGDLSQSSAPINPLPEGHSFPPLITPGLYIPAACTVFLPPSQALLQSMEVQVNVVITSSAP